MNKRAATRLLCLLVLLGVAWAIGSTDWWKTRREFAAIAAEVTAAPKLVLFEGLPHKRADDDLFRSEVHSKPTIKIQKHFFYERPLEVPPEAVASLRALCADADNSAPGLRTKHAWAFTPTSRCDGPKAIPRPRSSFASAAVKCRSLLLAAR